MLKATKADNITLCLCTLIKDANDEGTLKASNIIQGELEEYQEKGLSERTSSEKCPLNPKLERYKDSADELTIEKKAHPKEGAAKYHGEDWPNVPSAPPMTSIIGDDIKSDMQLQKLEFEIKLHKLTNESQELKRVSSIGKNNDLEKHQFQLERALSQAHGE